VQNVHVELNIGLEHVLVWIHVWACHWRLFQCFVQWCTCLMTFSII